MNASLATTNPLLEAALAAHAADLCVIPAKANGSKAPFGDWKQYQTERPSPDDLLGWFSGRYAGMGLVTGAVSGRLQCLEIEGVFAFRYQELRDRLESAGLLEEWDRWLEGYAERSPGGGIHVLVRVEGEGPLQGNSKLALGPLDAEGKAPTWIETRGEGGFVIVAPSGGSVHPSGKPWLLKSGSFDEIAHTTRDLWDAIVDVCCSFDESPASAEPAPVSPRPARQQGDGWIGAALDSYPSLQAVMQSHGWSYVRDEPLGQLWRRPGKQHGHSARINGSGRLINFSSSTPLPIGRQTLDAVDVDLAYQLGRMPTLDERTAALREFRPDAPSVSNSASLTAPQATTEGAGGDGLNLPDSFWLERPYLAHVYAAAISELIPPDALWLATKTMYAATIPYNFRILGNATLDYVGVLAGESGASKSTSKKAALTLLAEATNLDKVMLGLPPGSGEGMTEVYLQRDKDGGQSYKLRGANFYIDEGTWLFDTASRAGSTTIQMIKQAWSGELTGSLAATAERNRFLRAADVRFSLLIGIQPGVAAKFMSAQLADGGLPQRICWAWTNYPGMPDAEVEHPGPLDVPFFPVHEHAPITEITFCDEVRTIIRRERLARVRGESSEQLDSHENLAKAKAAAIHALMDGRMEVSEADWRLATQEWEVSRRIRTHILAAERSGAADSVRARGVASAHEQLAREDVFLQRGVMAAGRKVQGADGPVSWRELKDALASYRRRHSLDAREIVEAAEAQGFIVKSGEGYIQGSVKF